MLTFALAATLIGFVLLVIGLISGTVWLAVACIIVCLIGLGFLIADIVTSGRRGGGAADDGESFGFDADGQVDRDGHDRVSDGWVSDDGVSDGGYSDAANGPSDQPNVEGSEARGAPLGSPQSGSPQSGSPQSGSPQLGSPQNYPAPPLSSSDDQRQALWQGVVSPRSGPGSVPPDAETEVAQRPLRRDAAGSAGPAASSAEGGYADYVRSVGGVEPPPAAEPTMPAPPMTAPTTPAPPMPARPMPARDFPQGQSATRPPQHPPIAEPEDNVPAGDPGGREQGNRRETFDPLDPRWRPPQED